MREAEMGQRNSGGESDLKEAEAEEEGEEVLVVEGEERCKENFHLDLPLPMALLLSSFWRLTFFLFFGYFRLVNKEMDEKGQLAKVGLAEEIKRGKRKRWAREERANFPRGHSESKIVVTRQWFQILFAVFCHPLFSVWRVVH